MPFGHKNSNSFSNDEKKKLDEELEKREKEQKRTMEVCPSGQKRTIVGLRSPADDRLQSASSNRTVDQRLRNAL